MTRTFAATLALFVAALATTGCFVSTSDDDQQGVLNFTWSLTDSQGPIDCASAGVSSVSFLLTRDDTQGFDEIFSCAPGAGLSGPVGLDATFAVSPCALDDNDQCLSAPVVFETDTYGACDAVDGNLCIYDSPDVLFALP